ncbi:MAG: hypothetical protein KC413_10510, partial [Anaerolineales bacterium]|nr:hypothetical protein [Anaerolineales bacterium]
MTKNTQERPLPDLQSATHWVAFFINLFRGRAMHTNDLQLSKEDIGQLENVEQIIHFFAQLGYDVDNAIPLDHASLGMDTEDLRQQIRHLHRVASDPDEELIIYFL